MKSPLRNILLAMATVFASAVLIYQNSISSELLWDDSGFVSGNYFLADCSNLKTILDPIYLIKPLPVPMSGRPAVNASILIDTCRGAGAAGMRRTNIILHAANSVLVFTAACAFTGSLAPAVIAGLIFALHPLAAEPVAVVTFRSQLLCCFFYLCALLCGYIWLKSRKTSALVFSILAFIAAMLSNEAGVTFPLTFILLCLISEKPYDRRQLTLYFSLCAAATMAYIWFRLPRGGYSIPGGNIFDPKGALSLLYPGASTGRVQPDPEGLAELTKLTYTMHLRMPQAGTPFVLHPDAPPWNAVYFSWKLRLLTMTGIAGGYLRTLLLPMHLQLDYNPALIRGYFAAMPGFFTIICAGTAAWILKKKQPLIAFGILFIFISLLPEMNFIPIYNLKADRYLYLALIGYALAAAGAAAAAKGKFRTPALAGLICYALALGTVTFMRNPELRNNFNVFYSMTRGAPEVPRAEINMAAAYAKRNDPAGVMKHLRRSLALQENPGVRRLLEEIERTGHIPEGSIIK